MILFLLLQLPILLHLIFGCGGKKKKNGKTSKEGSKLSKPPPPPPSAMQSQSKETEPKPEEAAAVAPPPKPASPPKPVVQDTKVAEMLPESIKEDEMKGGIQLPNPPKNMKCEGEIAAKEKAPEAKKDEIM